MAAGVMKGRRFRFHSRDGDRVTVDAWPVSHVLPLVILGEVERVRVSTDSKIAGTRLRRPGRGRYVYRALVPHSERDGLKRYLQRTYPYDWRLEPWTGTDFETRREAAEALAEWHDHPEKRVEG